MTYSFDLRLNQLNIAAAVSSDFDSFFKTSHSAWLALCSFSRSLRRTSSLPCISDCQIQNIMLFSQVERKIFFPNICICLFLTCRGNSDISFNLGQTWAWNDDALNTSLTKPHSQACVAVIFLLKSNISLAFTDPIIFGKVMEEQASGHRPSSVNGVCKDA